MMSLNMMCVNTMCLKTTTLPFCAKWSGLNKVYATGNIQQADKVFQTVGDGKLADKEREKEMSMFESYLVDRSDKPWKRTRERRANSFISHIFIELL